MNLLDIDLDYFNKFKSQERRMKCLRSIIGKLPRSLPCEIFTEHHEILSIIGRWVQLDILKPRFIIYHVDQHHDYYNAMFWTKENINCGNYGYFIPAKYYKKVVWVVDRIDEEETYGSDWSAAKRILKEQKIQSMMTEKYLWSPSKIGGVCFAVSPDFVEFSLKHLQKMIQTVADYFSVETIVRLANPEKLCSCCPSNWERVCR